MCCVTTMCADVVIKCNANHVSQPHLESFWIWPNGVLVVSDCGLEIRAPGVSLLLLHTYNTPGRREVLFLLVFHIFLWLSLLSLL